MKDSVKMIAAIVIFATVACAGLALVYDATEPAIKANTVKKISDARKELFPEADAFEDLPGGAESSSPKVVLGETAAAKKDGRVIGVVTSASTGGFNGPINALVGVRADGTVTGVRILSHTETPGLGAYANSPAYFIDKPAKTKTFYGQFEGLSVNDNITVDKDGGDVTAITAATITSRAVALLVSEALNNGYELLSSYGGEE